MLFAFVYMSYGTAFYVHVSDDGYCAKVCGEWAVGETVEEVTACVDQICIEMINLANQG